MHHQEVWSEQQDHNGDVLNEVKAQIEKAGSTQGDGGKTPTNIDPKPHP